MKCLYKNEEKGMNKEICPLCQKPLYGTSYFGHFSGGGICMKCYKYLESVFNIQFLQRLSQGLEYLALLADREQDKKQNREKNGNV